MCLWLITACLGLLPANQPSNNVIVIGAPAPILQPTAAPVTTTTVRPPNPPASGNMTVPPPPLTTNPPVLTTTTTMRPLPPPTTAAPPTSAMPPITMAQTNPPPPPPPATTNAPSTAPGVVNVRICIDPNVVCVANPNQPVTGAPAIDPRLGSTPPAAYQQQITGYIAPLPPYDAAVRFPQKRSIKPYWVNGTKEFEGSEGNAEIHLRRKRQNSCTCVAPGTCTTFPSGGAGMIDFRIVTPAGQCPVGLVYCCFTATIACGTRQTVPSTNIVIGAGQAKFGDYPWMVIILTSQNDYIAGGVLIDQYNVLTVIHRLTPYLVAGTAPNAKVRLGEWDASATYEPLPFQEYTIRRVFTHPSFNAATLQYDIAVVRLSTPVPLAPAAGAAATINRACLPAVANNVYTGQRCWVTGWGRNAFNAGLFQQILKEVDVPIVDPITCQTQLRNARLGASYVLDTTSFICAGGEVNKDACTGDGGSGLVCQVNGQWTVVGIVAWGLGCAMANVPGVYINVASLLPWIQQQVATA